MACFPDRKRSKSKSLSISAKSILGVVKPSKVACNVNTPLTFVYSFVTPADSSQPDTIRSKSVSPSISAN